MQIVSLPCAALVVALACFATVAGATPPRPNIVVILVDDMGFSDLGCYGSEIPTPRIDSLAAGGLRFSQFYNTGRCCPTRASLLTGLYSHQAGVGHMVEDSGLPGYRGRLGDSCVTIAEALRGAGYHTSIVGKWHVGQNHGVAPWNRGFDRSLNAAAGGFYQAGSPRCDLWLDGEKITADDSRLPNDWYSTDLWTTFGLKFVDDAIVAKQPFFLYVGHNAPHFPLQAPAEEIAKFRGRYRAGWDALREERLARQRKLGLLADRWTPAPRPQAVAAWESLSPEEQDRFDHLMAVYAAVVHRMDKAVGDLVDGLERRGVLDDTLILFLSDNGGNAEAGPRGRTEGDPTAARSDWFCGESWAFLQNVPFRKYKHFNHEGGIATPLIVHWPAGITARGEWRHDPGHLIDILPTCLDVAGGEFPRERQGKPAIPLEGRSLVSAFAGEPIAREALYWEHEGNAAVRVGDLKLVRLGAKGPWELYDLQADRTEQHDLAATRPADVARLADLWQAWAQRVHAVPRPEQKRPREKPKAAATDARVPVRPVSMRQPGATIAEPPAAVAASRIALDERPDRVVVTVDGAPFTEYLFKQDGLRRPVLFPLHGPHGLTLTRSWPVGPKAPGDPIDHPHHESFWFAHGDVNGQDFWAPKKGERIEQVSLDHVGDCRIEATSRWLGPDGKPVCTDRRVLAFAAEGDDRVIDHTITITASHGPLVFGDTKEGTMALRVRPELNVKQAKDAPPATGHYLNDSGDRDAAAWGKPAAWVDLSGTVDGKMVGITCFDHPTNLRHPTCWHARDYGLFTANPFGLHDFTKAPKGAGRFELPAGESLTLKHRWLLHAGDAEAAKVAARFAAWAADDER